MTKQVTLVVVLLLCARPCSATNGLHPTCANICRSYASDDVSYPYCVISCKEALNNKVKLDNVGYYYPSQLSNYFQNGEEVSMGKGSESNIIDYYNPVEESRERDDDDDVNWPPTGTAPKRLSPVVWRKTTEGDPADLRMSFRRITAPNLFLSDRQSTSDAQKRVSSFVRIGRASHSVNGRQDGPFTLLGRLIEEEEVSGDPILELENKTPCFVCESGEALMEEPERKRVSSFVRIGRSLSDLHSNRAQGYFHSKHNEGGVKRVSSFVRIGRPHLDKGEKGVGPLLEVGKSQSKVGNIPSSANRVRKSLTENAKKRSSSFVRIGKSPLDEEEKRASSFVRVGKSPLDEEEKRASSFVRVGKSPLDEEEKRASSFVRVGKSPLDDEEKRASSFVRIGKSPLDDEEKRASSFVRIGKSSVDELDKRASSFVRIGKSLSDEENKRSSSFVRIGKSPLYEDKRASSFVRIGKSPLYGDKRASSFVRIGKSPSYKDKRVSSFVRIGKSPLDENNGNTRFSEVGHKRGAARPSLLRGKKRPVGDKSERRADSFTPRTGVRLQPDEFQMDKHNQGRRYSAYWRLRKPYPGEGDPNGRNILRVARPAVESLLNENEGATSLLSSRMANQMFWVPVRDDDERR